jgi:hypothetical protein
LAGRPIGDGLMRKRLMKSFLANEKQAMAAMARRWASTRYVQDMWELLAKLEGEMSKDAGEGGHGVQVILLQQSGRPPPRPRDIPGSGDAAEARGGVLRTGRRPGPMNDYVATPRQVSKWRFASQPSPGPAPS